MTSDSHKEEITSGSDNAPEKPLPKPPNVAVSEPIRTSQERIKTEVTSSQRHDETGNPKKEATLIEQWQLALNAIMVLITGFGVGVFWYQLGEMRSATKAAAKATNIAEKTLRIDERAWVSIKQASPSLDLGTKFKITSLIQRYWQNTR